MEGHHEPPAKANLKPKVEPESVRALFYLSIYRNKTFRRQKPVLTVGSSLASPESPGEFYNFKTDYEQVPLVLLCLLDTRVFVTDVQKYI